MTQEEKAKAYDEALERAREIYKADFKAIWLENLFPELAESEDERIRKGITELVKQSSEILDKKNQERMLAWLEKQKPFEQSIEDERIKKCIIDTLKGYHHLISTGGVTKEQMLAWLEKQESVEEIVERCKTSWYNEGKIQGQIEGLTNDEKYQQGWHDAIEKQGEQKPTQETEPFEAEHGKYYYCIKDYFCGGKKQASKGDVVQALRGLPIMGLKDASEYFLPVNFIKCNSSWSEEDKKKFNRIYYLIGEAANEHAFSTTCRLIGDKECVELQDFLKSLKQRMGG